MYTTADAVDHGWQIVLVVRGGPEVDVGSEEWTPCRRMRRRKKIRECWWVATTSDSTDRNIMIERRQRGGTAYDWSRWSGSPSMTGPIFCADGSQSTLATWRSLLRPVILQLLAPDKSNSTHQQAD